MNALAFSFALLSRTSMPAKPNPADDRIVAVVSDGAGCELETIDFKDQRIVIHKQHLFTKAEVNEIKIHGLGVSSFRSNLAVLVGNREFLAHYHDGRWRRTGSISDRRRIAMNWRDEHTLVYPGEQLDVQQWQRNPPLTPSLLYTTRIIGKVKLTAAIGGYGDHYNAYQTDYEVESEDKFTAFLQNFAISHLPTKPASGSPPRDWNYSLKFNPQEFGRFSSVGSVSRSGGTAVVVGIRDNEPVIASFSQGRFLAKLPVDAYSSIEVCATPDAILTWREIGRNLNTLTIYRPANFQMLFSTTVLAAG